jgi:hypothetical protein
VQEVQLVKKAMARQAQKEVADLNKRLAAPNRSPRMQVSTSRS